jgi:hypothetical protein
MESTQTRAHRRATTAAPPPPPLRLLEHRPRPQQAASAETKAAKAAKAGVATAPTLWQRLLAWYGGRA